LAVENLNVRVSNIEGKLETVISKCSFCTSVVKKARFPWLVSGKTFRQFSDIVVQTIMCYLTDDDRFLLREVNMLFYNAYYTHAVDDFNVTFNFERAIRMAMKGRVFHSVEVLRVCSGEAPRNALSNITATSFPNLKRIRVVSGVEATIWHKPKAIAKFFHRGLMELEVHLDGAFPKVNLDARFPDLKILKIIFCVTTMFTLPSSHKNLEEINLTNSLLEDTNDISRKRFPMLRIINVVGPQGKIKFPAANVTPIGDSVHEVQICWSPLQTSSPVHKN